MEHTQLCMCISSRYLNKKWQAWIYKKKIQYHSQVFVIMGKDIKSMDNGFHDFIMHEEIHKQKIFRVRSLQ